RLPVGRLAPVEIRQEFVERGEDRVAVHVYPDPPDPAAPLVVIWPAMGVPARYYRPFATELSQAGLAVAVADLPGTGASTPPPTRRGGQGYAGLADAVGAVLEHLATGDERRRPVLRGHSLGGRACALSRAGAEKPAADGLALIAVGLPCSRSSPPRRGRGV